MKRNVDLTENNDFSNSFSIIKRLSQRNGFVKNYEEHVPYLPTLPKGERVIWLYKSDYLIERYDEMEFYEGYPWEMRRNLMVYGDYLSEFHQLKKDVIESDLRIFNL